MIYLAGPIKDCEADEVHTWRDYCIEKIKYPTINPAIRDFSKMACDDCMKDIVEPDKADIDRCVILLANCWKVSAGTSMEILYAWENQVLVVTVLPKGNPSAWVVAHSHKIYKTLDQAIDYINSYAGEGK